MRNLWIGLFLVALFAVGLTGQHCLSVDWFTADEMRHSDVLDEQLRYLNWCHERRSCAMEAVASGKMSLLEAAAHFAAVEAESPPALSARYACFPGDTVEEKLCRHVIQHVEMMLWADSRRDAVVKRLQEELTVHLSSGRLRLPDLPPSSLSPRSWSWK